KPQLIANTLGRADREEVTAVELAPDASARRMRLSYNGAPERSSAHSAFVRTSFNWSQRFMPCGRGAANYRSECSGAWLALRCGPVWAKVYLPEPPVATRFVSLLRRCDGHRSSLSAAARSG